MKKHPPIPPPLIPDLPPGGVSQHAIEEMKSLQAALSERKLEALKLYRPMPHQEEFHKCMASERIVLGGNRGGKSLAVAVEAAPKKRGRKPKVEEAPVAC